MRKPLMAASALTLALAATSPTPGQAPGTGAARLAPAVPAANPVAPPATSPAEAAPRVYGNGEELPGPVDPDQIPKATLALPTGSIEPYLLTKKNGPFMVLAHTFRGPDCSRVAMALTIELRQKFHLPAYIWFVKVQPGRSNIRDVPPTADAHIVGGEKGIAHPRNFDEAAVLVGDCKSMEESLKLLHDVKKLHPETLDGVPHLFAGRMKKGLSRAMMTTNPMRASQELYPGKAEFDPAVAIANFEKAPKAIDPLVKQMNGGPHTIYGCKGRYTMVVADFMGDRVAVAGDPRFLPPQVTRGQSKLRQAAEDAEKLANALAKDDNLKRAGFEAYVYHDRTSSKVTVGAFQAPNDPKAQELQKLILEKVRVTTSKSAPAGSRGAKPVDDIVSLAPNPNLLPVPGR